MLQRRHSWMLLLGLVASGSATATEPNETFFEATLLAPGTLTVSDELTVAVPPDTFLGVQNHFGQVYATDDDGSPVGSGAASGLGGVPTNSGSIQFLVTGYGDESFAGSHSESGGYRVYVEVYDFFEDPLDSFFVDGELTPGAVGEFNYSDAEWIGGSYDVYIDNTIGGSAGLSDVDFFTFTGLTSGASFTARTLAPGAPDADTYLGWFDSTGTLLDADDDSGGGYLSLIGGVVPNSGELTFAVTGVDDTNFIGEHNEQYPYELQITLGGPPLAADFNHDAAVDAEDLSAWTAGFNALAATADADGDGDSDGQDLLVWQRQLGGSSAAAAATVTPEPSALALALSTLLVARYARNRRYAA